MIRIENTNKYKANEGCLIVRKADDFIMGNIIDLGNADSIENYEDREFSEEVIKTYTEDSDFLVNDNDLDF